MSRLPVNQPYTITTAFGVPDPNARFGRHSGIDYAGFGSGRPIYAPTSGQLTNIVSPTGGNMVVIYDGKYWHRLMHNSSFSRADGKVNEGDEVARAGTTGLSTGVHCHWDVNSQGVYPTSFSAFIDPNQWLKQGGNMPYVDQSVIDDYEGWKKMGIFLSKQPAYPAMGGKAGEWLRDPSGIKVVLDDYEQVKQNANKKYKPVTKQLYEEA